MRYYRHLPFEKLYNCRDLGGYPTADGGVTRFGVFVRSEVPKEVTGQDLKALQAYGIRKTLDLRSSKEAEEIPSLLKEAGFAEYLLCPMFDEDAARGSNAAAGKSRKREAMPVFDGWGKAYVHMLESHRDWVQNVIRLAADCEGGCHFHCFTGKDRTGILASLLLSMAGVERRDLIAEYSLSMIYLRPFYEKLEFPAGLGENAGNYYSGFFSTSGEYMEYLLDHLDCAYGGINEFLRSCGVEDELFDQIKRKFVSLNEE